MIQQPIASHSSEQLQQELPVQVSGSTQLPLSTEVEAREAENNSSYTWLSIKQGKEFSSRRDKKKDIVYHRKRFNMLKYVQNKIIEKTYQRKNKGKKKKATIKPSTPISTKGLRRSPRMNEVTEGRRNSPLQSTLSDTLRSNSHRVSLQIVSNIAGFNPHSANAFFVGPAKFPTTKDIEDTPAPFPEIPIQAIQQVALEKCGLSPEEVTVELLMDAKNSMKTTPEEAGNSNNTPQQFDG
ncbi:hypothetical protein PR202_gb20479 [Eleusine coracana subsp. coracana]|uniref:Uncharacterized protein n=1 Tax=Eleusine coracana subsp. coracana TaxID=191504 RepID=A0AAV5FAH8_ELECO|nr:hypothetical protein PR202_gb20479 [Eleusine coracana subsp. coracana]